MKQTFFVGYLDKKAVYFVHFEVLELEYEVGLYISYWFKYVLIGTVTVSVIYKDILVIILNKNVYVKGRGERERDPDFAGPRSPGRAELDDAVHVEVGYV